MALDHLHQVYSAAVNALARSVRWQQALQLFQELSEVRFATESMGMWQENEGQTPGKTKGKSENPRKTMGKWRFTLC